MASEGPLSAGAGADTAGVGTVSWSSPGLVTASDNARSQAGLSAGGQSRYLVASGFGFAIPTGATIDGIVVEVERSRTIGLGTIRDNRVRIVKGGVVGATDQSDPGNWPSSASEVYMAYGSSSYLWGETWAAADINASDFGVAVSARNAAPKQSATAAIDHVRITVHYTEAAPPAGPPPRGRMSLSLGLGF